MPATLHYRTGSPDDAARLAEFAERAFRRSHAFDASEADLEAYVAQHFGEGQQAAELADPTATLFFAEAGPELVGYVQLRLDTRPAFEVQPSPVRFAEAKRVYVHEDWHGQGIAMQLMEHCFARARAEGCDLLWLSVWKQNHRAIRFYEKAGLTAIGEATFQMGADLQHDWVMAKRL